MRTRHTEDSLPLGQKIIDCIQSVLKQSAQISHSNIPGEGEERPFRAWLVSELLVGLLGWPAGRVVVGERFDLRLLDDMFPIVTIETKTPGHKSSKKEREDFEARLSEYATLRTAYFTDGHEWERLDLIAPSGVQEIQQRSSLKIDSATSEEAEGFFSPLQASRYFDAVPRLGRHAVGRDQPHILADLAISLNSHVSEMTTFFQSLFEGFRAGKTGKQVQGITAAIFEQWSEKSLIVPPSKVVAHLQKRFQAGSASSRDISKVLLDLGMTGENAAQATEQIVSLPVAQRQDAEALTEALSPLYVQAVHNLCAQTAHVILARALLYRVGEDRQVFTPLLSGTFLEKAIAQQSNAIIGTLNPALSLLDRVRHQMESFLPIVYKQGEFDWWYMEEKRAALGGQQLAWLRTTDVEFEHIAKRLLRMLDGYAFDRVDVDVWRNVYQNYLPADERQRIGGFYTPDELINLTLDLAQYKPEAIGLCELSFIDPACGSGAFVTGALARLLDHLQRKLPCHAHLHNKNLSEWKRAEQILQIVTECLHGIDVHPFAAFLTTLNVLFLVLPLYITAREKNPDFALDLWVFSADSLESPDAQLLDPNALARLNSRIQLTQVSQERYQKMYEKRFDRVFGNPPWGGVLKGPLAPIYDNTKKQRFANGFPWSARGKYDIYGLFMEHALQTLKPHGRFSMVTPDSFIDKDWAVGLRELLANKASTQFIIDLNPFGALFFNAMNTPCITVVNNSPTGEDVIALLAAKPDNFKGLSIGQRRDLVAATVGRVLAQIDGGSSSASEGFASAARIPVAQLRETARDRWNLAEPVQSQKRPLGWHTAASLLESSQGVTVGGEKCMDIFIMSAEKASLIELESSLVHDMVKGLETIRWRTPRTSFVLLYPYSAEEGSFHRAFLQDATKEEDLQTRRLLQQVGLMDDLNFDKSLDKRETEIVRAQGINRLSAEALLRHRIALGLVKYPKTAAYLVQSYEQLEGRVMKKRNIRTFNREWYEYIWPRNPIIMMVSPKILSPRLTPRVRFSLDTEGLIPQDSCVCLTPTKKTKRNWQGLQQQLTKVLGRQATDIDGYCYCLAFLNSADAQYRMVTGRRPTPKGSYAITDKFLQEIPIPPPRDKAQVTQLLGLVAHLTTNASDQQGKEQELDGIVLSMLR